MLFISLIVAIRDRKVKIGEGSIIRGLQFPTCHTSFITMSGQTCSTRQRKSCPVLAGAWHVIGHWQSWTQTWGGLCQGPTCQSASALSPPRTMGWCCPVRRGQGRAGQGHPGRALLLSTAGLPCMPSNLRQVRKNDVCAALHDTTL